MAPPAPRAPVLEPWMVRPAPQTAQSWQPQAAASRSSAALEPIDLPPAIEQGVDMIYIDQELVPRAVKNDGLMHDISFADWSGAPVDMFTSVNPIYTELRRGLVKYRQRWSDLPQIAIPAGRRSSRPRPATASMRFASGSAWPPATSSTRRPPPRSRNSRPRTGSRPTALPARARSTRSTVVPATMSS